MHFPRVTDGSAAVHSAILNKKAPQSEGLRRENAISNREGKLFRQQLAQAQTGLVKAVPALPFRDTQCARDAAVAVAIAIVH